MASGSVVLTSGFVKLNDAPRPAERLPPRIAKTPPRDTGLETYGYITVRGHYGRDAITTAYSDVAEYLSEGGFRPHSDGVVLESGGHDVLDYSSIDKICLEYFRTSRLDQGVQRSSIFPVLRTRDSGYLPMHREKWSTESTTDSSKVETLKSSVVALTVHIALTPQIRLIVPSSELNPSKFSRHGVELLDPVVVRPILIRLNPGDVLIHRSDLGKEFPRLNKNSNSEYGLTFGYSNLPEIINDAGVVTRYYNGRPVNLKS